MDFWVIQGTHLSLVEKLYRYTNGASHDGRSKKRKGVSITLNSKA